MARTYSKVLSKFWTGRTGRELKEQPLAYRTVAVWLLTSEPATANPYGLYVTTPAWIAGQIGSGLHEDDVARAIAWLEQAGFCLYDAGSLFIWVSHMAKVQLLEDEWKGLKESDWRTVNARKWYATCPDNPFLGPFFDLYASYLHLDERREEGASRKPLKVRSLSQDHVRTLEEVQPKSTESLLVTPFEYVLELTPPPMPTAEPSNGSARRPPLYHLLKKQFEEWWTLYPAKTGKGRAWKAYEKLQPPHGQLMATTRAYLASEQWAARSDGRRPIPYPTTFLNGGQWDDTPTPQRDQFEVLTAHEIEQFEGVLRRTMAGGLNLSCYHDPPCQGLRACKSRQIHERRQPAEPAVAEEGDEEP